MNEIESVSGAEVRRTIDQEVDLLMSAVLLVAAGAARSTTVVGLRLCEPVMAIIGPLAQDRGVSLEPLWGPDEAGCDVRVRMAGETPGA